MPELMLSRGLIAHIDEMDADLAAMKWSLSRPSGDKTYAGRNFRDETGRRYFERLHRVVYARIAGRELGKSDVIDHVNGNGLDCRRNNLRLTSAKNNALNKQINKRNRAGFKGVSYVEKTGKYRARIAINGKQIHLGFFDSPEAAHAAYCDAARQHFGDFAHGGRMTDYVILDTETTGLGKTAEPLSIAVIHPDGDVLFNKRIRPTVPVEDGAAAVHGITDDMLADEPSFTDVWPELETILRGKTLAIYNAEFDLRLLRSAARAHGIALPDYPTRCLMLQYASAFGERGKYGSPKWHKLGVAYAAQFGKSVLLDNAHDALADCQMAAAIMRLLDNGGLKVRHGHLEVQE